MLGGRVWPDLLTIAALEKALDADLWPRPTPDDLLPGQDILTALRARVPRWEKCRAVALVRMRHFEANLAALDTRDESTHGPHIGK
ncbi:hypothetical protein ACFXJO_16505 [Streptomyces lavendulae]|uniref:hypothetical protein n=1 Tax=Streptomyces lavendulae TaxID=1914 RepID=UPI003684A9A4